MHADHIDENSLEAFEAAISAGATHVESDVHATLDGVAVLFHDDNLERVAAMPVAIKDLTLTELKAIRMLNGTSIPTLAEALERFPTLRLNLDVKSSGAIAPTAKAIEAKQAHDRVLVSSFSTKRRKQTVALLSSEVAVSAGAVEIILLWVSHIFGGIGFSRIANNLDALQIPVAQGPVRLGTKSFISRARKHGLEIHFWTINSPAQAQKLLELGATGIVSDRIDLIQA
jgi:glycerophosphoryl diester phosphodiesterase